MAFDFNCELVVSIAGDKEGSVSTVWGKRIRGCKIEGSPWLCFI